MGDVVSPAMRGFCCRVLHRFVAAVRIVGDEVQPLTEQHVARFVFP